MKEFIRPISPKLTTAIKGDFASEEMVFFDIETTGFAPEKSSLYLIGCIYNENGEYFSNDLTYLSSARSIGILEQVWNSVSEIENGIKNNMPIDMIEIDIKEAWNLLGTITGESYEDELIDQLFSQFCLGK